MLHLYVSQKINVMQTSTKLLTSFLFFLFILCTTSTYAQVQEKKNSDQLQSGKTISGERNKKVETQANISLGEGIENAEKTSEVELLKNDNSEGKSKNPQNKTAIIRSELSDSDFQSE